MPKIEKNKKSKKVKKIKKSENYFSSFNFAFDLVRTFLIFSILVFLVISFIFSRMQSHHYYYEKNTDEQSVSFNDFMVFEADERSFGSLNIQEGDGKEDAAGGSVVGSTIDIGVMPENPVSYEYTYTGGDFETFKDEELVYRRIKPSLSNTLNTSFVVGSAPFIDLSNFNDVKLSSFNLIQDVDFGYNFNFSLSDGSFSMYKNWNKWPTAEKVCGPSSDNFYCFEEYRINESDILSDEELLTISNNFLRKHSVDLGNFEQGEVQNQWLKYYNKAENKASFHIPETNNIIYPLKIDGKKVYENYGNVSGLNIEVDVRERKVSGLYNLYNQQYEASNYETETDKDRVIEMAEKKESSYYNEGDFETKVIEMDTPVLGLVKSWTYDEVSRSSYEVYVPAYIFPIKKDYSGINFYRDNVVVPAVEDFFNDYNKPGIPRVLPEPMIDYDIVE
jgi:hypothetical protein